MKTRPRRIPLFLCILVGCAAGAGPLLANGGGYHRGGVKDLGGIVGFEPQATENIRILDEKLTIDLGPAEAEVEVRYLMRNETQKRVKVRFGFPVEESLDAEWLRKGPPEAVPSLRNCQDYAATASGLPLAVRWHPEQSSPLSGKDVRFHGIAGWLVSEMTFAPGEEKPVRISFRSRYPVSHDHISDDLRASPSIFKYRLSTAACWSGTIATGKIVIRPKGIDPRELRVLKPVNRFKRDGDHWVWDFDDLEPTLADDLEIEAQPEFFQTRAIGEPSGDFVERAGQWSLAHANYAIIASSTLPPDENHKYDAENVKIPRGWAHGRQTWAEGAPGPGIGEWLELKPVQPKPLSAISITPGFDKNEQLFRANNRPKKIRIDLNGEHHFHADIPDSPEEVRLPILAYQTPVRTLRLTIVEVWRGDHFDDLCISGIRLHVPLSKKPKTDAAR